MRKRRFLTPAVAGLVTLVLAACGGGSGSSPSTPATGEPIPGGKATVLMLSDPTTLDPARLGNAYAITPVLGNALYGTLLTDDKKTGEIQYSLIESFETTDQGATFTLKLRPDLVFSDSTPFDAEAVKFNWDRMRDPATGSTSIAEASMIKAIKVVDDVVLEVTMATPVPSYAYSILTSSMNWVASPTALRKGAEAFNENPIGAGPFTLQRWNRQATIELIKNPRYWDAPKPYLDGLTLRAATDSGQRLNTVVSGGADVAVDSNWLNIAKAREQGLTVDLQELNGGILIALNMRRAPFDDIRARRAVSAALDLDALNLAVYSGEGKMVDTLFTKGSLFYSDTPLRKHDKETAQRLFDELAADGKPVSFTFSAYPTTENRTTAENIQAQLGAFRNVKVEIATVDFSQLAKVRSQHDFDMIVSGGFFRDPEPGLWTAFHSSSVANQTGVDDPTLNEALLAGRTEITQEAREKAYATVQQQLTDLVPVIYLARVAPSAIANTNVGGVIQYGNGSLRPEELWIKK
ncbi:extracellular solute-binding protein family 5 [Parafrankia sp. EAN1pec]|uniref:ABC transporter substrate-binding protein n=1 Tax=Parafrankia sp. (strain EAN1pec) TaxID=298653 RepID=UPI00005443F0|nr:extracellular solute-binding protein family 5 [Frankia sp. EAN1pec]